MAEVGKPEEHPFREVVPREEPVPKPVEEPTPKELPAPVPEKEPERVGQ